MSHADVQPDMGISSQTFDRADVGAGCVRRSEARASGRVSDVYTYMAN